MWFCVPQMNNSQGSTFRFVLKNSWEKKHFSEFLAKGLKLLTLEGVYTKPEIKPNRNEILTHHKINSVYITFHCGRNEVKFRFGGSPRKTVHSVKANHFCFDEINTWADVSIPMFYFG